MDNVKTRRGRKKRTSFLKVTPQDKTGVTKVLRALKKLSSQFVIEEVDRSFLEQYINKVKISHPDEGAFGCLSTKSIWTVLSRQGMNGELINTYLTIVCEDRDYDFWRSEVMCANVKKTTYKKGKLCALLRPIKLGWSVGVTIDYIRSLYGIEIQPLVVEHKRQCRQQDAHSYRVFVCMWVEAVVDNAWGRVDHADI